MKKISIFILLLVCMRLQAQELFVFTEPASNMPTHSLGARVSNSLMKEKQENGYSYHAIPELMWGVNKRLMLHVDGFVSNQAKTLTAEGFGLYAKYRFISNDAVHSHFRMAAYARASYNSSIIHQEEIQLWGHNSGYEVGLIATQLLHKVALSTTAGFAKAMDNNKHVFPLAQSAQAFNYSLSFGKLMLPKTYINYGQTNLNLMVELLGQTLAGNGHSSMDIAPSVQFIFNSQARVDLSYRQVLYSSIYRTSPNGFMVRFEYLFFNAIR